MDSFLTRHISSQAAAVLTYSKPMLQVYFATAAVVFESES